MLFGEQYDLSLGYILKFKGRFSKKTIEFIKELPEELVDNIREIYDEGIETNHGIFDMTNSEKRPRSFYEIYNNDICYKFYVMCKELYIVKSKIVNEAKVDVFSLSLKPLDLKDVMGMKEQTELHLGSVSIGEYCKFNFMEMEYDLKKTKSGNVIKRSCSFLSSTIKMKDKNISNEIDINTIRPKKLIKNK